MYGITASPLGFADDKGNLGVLDTVDNHWTERIARVACVEMGCSIMISGFSMTGAQAKASLVDGSLSACTRIGAAIVQARSENLDPVQRVVEVLGGRELFGGKIVDVQRGTTSGFARGVARIAGDGVMQLLFQNENLVALLDDEPLVTTPDLIIVLEAETGEPITTEGLRYGQRVRVIAAPSDERWHSEAGIALAGPRYFGYDFAPIRYDGKRQTA